MAANSPTTTTNATALTIRDLQTHAEYGACVDLQRETWGAEFTECVPTTMLMISQKVGGVAAGAFDRDQQLVGFVYGMTGVRGGQVVHWSHMLSVRPEYRRAGMGRRLKLHQRERVAEVGVEVMFWTFDPLQAGNARFNLHGLHVTIVEYVENLYGTNTGSDLHSGLGTDRFVVRWPISESPPKTVSVIPPNADQAPILNITRDGAPLAEPAEPRAASIIRIAVPLNIEAEKEKSVSRAFDWRYGSRTALQRYLQQGFHVAAFQDIPGQDYGCYVLMRPEERT